MVSTLIILINLILPVFSEIDENKKKARGQDLPGFTRMCSSASCTLVIVIESVFMNSLY